MERQQMLTLASGVVGGSLAAVVTTLGQFSFRIVGGAAVVGLCLGIVVGARILTVEKLVQLMKTPARRLRVMATILPIFGLLGWAIWNGIGTRYWVAMVGLLLIIFGWVTVFQIGQNAEVAAADSRTETLVRLPETDTIGVFGMERYRTYIEWLTRLGVVGSVGLFGWLGYDTGDPFVIVGGLPAILFLIVGYNYTVRITEAGVVSETYFGSTISISISMGSKLAAWDEITGWEVTDGYLRINTAIGPNLTYDCERIDDMERVRAVLGDYVGQGEYRTHNDSIHH